MRRSLGVKVFTWFLTATTLFNAMPLQSSTGAVYAAEDEQPIEYVEESYQDTSYEEPVYEEPAYSEPDPANEPSTEPVYEQDPVYTPEPEPIPEPIPQQEPVPQPEPQPSYRHGTDRRSPAGSRRNTASR